jgi:hypothetical protein
MPPCVRRFHRLSCALEGHDFIRRNGEVLPIRTRHMPHDVVQVVVKHLDNDDASVRLFSSWQANPNRVANGVRLLGNAVRIVHPSNGGRVFPCV